MTELGQAALLALNLILGLDPELFAIVGLSLRVSLSATVIAFVLGAALGTALALIAFPGRRAMVIVVNALLGLPPVVVGLLVYLLLSRSGPLGSLGLLFTPGAMIIAQAILGTPIVAALVHRAIEGLWRDYGDALQMDGASLSRAGFELLAMAKAALLTTFLAAFGRAIAEVGAILVVGGNIRGATRTMTTAIALETSKGDLALALGLGLILISLSLLVSTLAFSMQRWTERVA
jgi:tungstate transport system permease protein